MNTIGEEKWLVLGEDERMKWIAKYLSKDGRSVYYKFCSNWDEQVQKLVESYKPSHIVLPILPMQQEVDSCIREGTFFVGKLNGAWEKQLEQVSVHHYLEHEGFIWKNAYLTALGLVSYLLKQEEIILSQKFLITGFGRVAKMTAKLLQSLGADVMISVRSSKQLAEAEALGYSIMPFEGLSLDGMHYLVNTIPARWLSVASVKETGSVQVLDVASAPGCLTDDDVPENYKLLHALPAKYFPKHAAYILTEAIEQLNKGGATC